MPAQSSQPKKAPKSKRKPKGAKVEWNPEKGLTLNEEVFCRFYVFNEPTRRNATLSYNAAYDKKLDEQPKDDAVYEDGWEDEETGKYHQGKMVQASSYDRCYAMCATEGSRLVKKPYISRRITEMLNELLTDTFVDGELTKVISQDEELSPKVRGIEEYNKLRKRTTTTTVEHKFKDLEEMSDEEIAAEQARLASFFNKGRGEKKPAKK